MVRLYRLFRLRKNVYLRAHAVADERHTNTAIIAPNHVRHMCDK